jgi:hypothetical protein
MRHNQFGQTNIFNPLTRLTIAANELEESTDTLVSEGVQIWKTTSFRRNLDEIIENQFHKAIAFELVYYNVEIVRFYFIITCTSQIHWTFKQYHNFQKYNYCPKGKTQDPCFYLLARNSLLISSVRPVDAFQCCLL